MTPIEWLSQHAHGFSDLTEPERAAIMHFALLWSFFEATALKTDASTDAIEKLAGEWLQSKKLVSDPFASPLAYFRDRYYENGKPSQHFGGLKLSEKDKPLVTAVLSGTSNDPKSCASALFIVVYRLRNNLFHGTKWAYGIRNQLDNFTQANKALMSALELQGL